MRSLFFSKYRKRQILLITSGKVGSYLGHAIKHRNPYNSVMPFLSIPNADFVLLGAGKMILR